MIDSTSSRLFDPEFSDCVIVDVIDSDDHWRLDFHWRGEDHGASYHVKKAAAAAAGILPEKGQSLRFYQKGPFQRIRGVVINGKVLF